MSGISESILVVASPEAAEPVKKLITGSGLGIGTAATAREALAELERKPYEAIVVDLDSAEPRGLEPLRMVVRASPDIPVIALGQNSSARDVVEAVKAGAADFLAQPVAEQDLLHALRKSITAAARSEPDPPPLPDPEGPLLGDSEPMRRVRDLVRRVASSNSTVLVRGESGTGKDLVARALHEQSPRQNGPLVKVHCAALPDNLLESELFGYEKGAFTGAAARKLGRVDLADGGTLFLDEIGDITAAMQVKLLRLLEDRRFERLGGTATITADVRFVAATHRDLEGMVSQRQFREDLFYRLNVVTVWMPPLRARREDIVTLAQHFCRQFAVEHAKPNLTLDEKALEMLRAQRWPGNVRQLRNLVERLVVLADSDSLGVRDIERELAPAGGFATQTTAAVSRSAAVSPPAVLRTLESASPTIQSAAASGPESIIDPTKVSPLSDDLREAEKKALLRALKHSGGNRSLAARILGVSRTTLYAKLEEHGIS